MIASILITGANGFIGSHTTLGMESLGHKVIPLDLFPRSADLSLLPIQTPSVIMNVTDESSFRNFCAHVRPTHIFHAAHPKRDESPAVLKFCYQALTTILETAKELKVRRVVYASSGALYGQLRKANHSPIKEEDAVTIYPTYFYRSAKIVSEWLGSYYKEHHDVPFVALRFSSVYGPGLGRPCGTTGSRPHRCRSCSSCLARPPSRTPRRRRRRLPSPAWPHSPGRSPSRAALVLSPCLASPGHCAPTQCSAQ